MEMYRVPRMPEPDWFENVLEGKPVWKLSIVMIAAFAEPATAAAAATPTIEEMKVLLRI